MNCNIAPKIIGVSALELEDCSKLACSTTGAKYSSARVAGTWQDHVVKGACDAALLQVFATLHHFAAHIGCDGRSL